MLLRFWGTRGSVPAPGPATVRYGGNTSCVELVVSGQESLILDAGTGLRQLRSLQSPPARVNILLTHLHMDHIQGLGFYAPMFSDQTEVHIWGPAGDASLRDQLTRYLSPPLFPEPLSAIPQVHIHDVGAEQFKIGSVLVRAFPVQHRGPTVGYRLEAEGITLAYIPDHEPGPDGQVAAASSMEQAAGQADVLVHDAQFGDPEYPVYAGWGHSAVSHTVSFAARCGVQRLVLFHHDPWHSDADCDRLLAQAREMWKQHGSADAVASAREGMDIDLAAWLACAGWIKALDSA